MKAFLAFALMVAPVFSGSYCLVSDYGGGTNCSYTSADQCAKDAQNMGGFCQTNDQSQKLQLATFNGNRYQPQPKSDKTVIDELKENEKTDAETNAINQQTKIEKTNETLYLNEKADQWDSDHHSAYNPYREELEKQKEEDETKQEAGIIGLVVLGIACVVGLIVLAQQ